MEKLKEKNLLSFETDLIELSRGHVEPTEKNILLAYNRAFERNVKLLGEKEFKNLSYYSNLLLKKLRKRKGDAVAQFVFKSQYTNYYKGLIENKGFNYALFVKILSDIKEAKV